MDDTLLSDHVNDMESYDLETLFDNQYLPDGDCVNDSPYTLINNSCKFYDPICMQDLSHATTDLSVFCLNC